MIQKLWKHKRLYLLLILYMLLSTGYNIAIPLINSDDDDESAHFRYVRYIAENNQLPSTPQERDEAGYRARDGYPPFYQGTLGVLLSWIEADDISFFYRRSESISLVREAMGDHWMFQSAQMIYPYQGSILLWHLSRFLSTLLTTATIAVTYFVALNLWPGKISRALLAAAIVAFIPRFVFVGATINDDNMLSLLMAIYIFFLVQLIKNKSPWFSLVMMGGVLGLSIITKFSVALIPFLTLIFLWLLSRQQRWGFKLLLQRIAVVGSVALFVSGWWFIFVLWNFTEIEEYGVISGTFNALVPDVTSNVSGAELLNSLTDDETEIERRGEQSFVEWFNYFSRSLWEARLVILPQDFLILSFWPWLVWTFFTGFIIVGIVITTWQGNRFQRTCISFFILHFLAFLPLMLIRHHLNGFIYETAQGRHVLMPSITVVGILMSAGWLYWTRPRSLRWLRPLLPGLLLFWSITQLYFVHHLFPKPVSVSTQPETHDKIPAVDVALNKMLFDAFELSGYSTHIVAAEAALELTLVWQSHAPSLTDYVTEVQLIDSQGQIVSGWIGHPAQGYYPTRSWFPGDKVYDKVKLPIHGLEPGNYTLDVSLREAYQNNTQHNNLPLFSTVVALPDQLQSYTLAWKRAELNDDDTKINVNYRIWPPKFFSFSYPLYRYRSTISIARSGDLPLSDGSKLDIQLIGPDGNKYGVNSSHGNLYNFIVEPNWPSGLYQINLILHRQNQESIEKRLSGLLQIENLEREFFAPPTTYQVNANFYNLFELLGYNLSDTRLEPGEVLSIQTIWQSLQVTNQRFRVFNHLYDSQNNIWLASDYPSPPYRGGTITWTPNQIINDRSLLWIDPETPPGIYTVHIGFFVTPNEDLEIRLPLVLDGQISDITYVSLGPIKIGGPPPEVIDHDSVPQYTRSDSFEGIIKLAGYDLEQMIESQEIKLTLYWQSLKITEQNYTSFIHLVDENNEILVQQDKPPAQGIYPTSLWDSGEIIKDEFRLAMPSDLSSGSYRLLVGLYNPVTGQRLLVEGTPESHVVLKSSFDLNP